MRVSAAALAGGLFGGLGTLCFLVAFGTDYWLLASDNCGPHTWQWQPALRGGNVANGTQQAEEGATSGPPALTLHHEGFFWRCAFRADPSVHAVWATFFTNQPDSKVCIHGYLFPLPVAIGQVPHPSYDATAVFRGFWTVLIVLGVVCALTGGFLLLCGVPFLSHKLCRLGGAFLLAAASLFLFVVVLYVLWAELVDVKRYILQEKGELCPDAKVSVHYGWSFMVAAAGVPLALVSGMLFTLVSRVLQARK
ncbi:transmembrane protein 182-like [Lampris incognitus]|uniref:transmembrane protein 182-like n=1 Tax=Lampris incognitus TaxID=2546036 RepID=UPI0024B49E8F|nr:transmembrane protein 182-like [Lampris incognitus]